MLANEYIILILSSQSLTSYAPMVYLWFLCNAWRISDLLLLFFNFWHVIFNDYKYIKNLQDYEICPTPYFCLWECGYG